MRIRPIHIALLALALVSACTDLDRTNLLDPENPGSYTTRISLVELFVNDSIYTTPTTVSPRSGWAESAVQALANEFGAAQMVYAQYHVGSTFHDELDTAINVTYYRTYLSGSDSSLPRIFINGPDTEIGGAASEAELNSTVRSTLQPYLGTICHYVIQGEVEVATDSITAWARLARLGTADAADLTVSYLFLRDAGDLHLYTVCNYVSGIAVPDLEAGEVIELGSRSIPNSDTLTISTCSVILAVKDRDGTVVQAALVEPD